MAYSGPNVMLFTPQKARNILACTVATGSYLMPCNLFVPVQLSFQGII